MKSLQIGLVVTVSLVSWLVFSTVAQAADFSLSFDGTNDYVEIPDASELDLTSAGTAELWFKKSSDTDWNFMIGKIGADDNTQPWSIYLYDGDNHRIVAVYFADGSSFSGIESARDIYQNDNQWTHLIVTWEISGATIEIRIYVDGSEVGYWLDTNTVSDITIGYTNDSPVVLGASYTESNRDFWFNGSMDEVRLYSRVLSAGEISDHYNKIYSNNDNLVARWNLNNGSGTVVADNSGNGHDGTIFGATWSTDAVTIPVTPVEVVAVSRHGSGPTAHPPEVQVIFPKRWDSFGKMVEIEYRAIDRNDESRSEKEKEWLGLGETPVSIFYSETSDIRRKKLIAERLPAEETTYFPSK